MEWFYEQNGKAVGPISRTDLIRLIMQGHVHPTTLVWTAKFKDEWHPAARAGLIDPKSTGESQKNSAKKRPFFEIRIEKFGVSPETGQLSHLPRKDIIAPEAVSSFWAWILLLVPDFLAMLPELIAYAHGEPWPEQTSLIGAIGVYLIAIIAVVLDRRELRRAAIKPPFLGWFLIPPVYFWLRAVRLRRGRGLFLCSILMIVLKMIVIFYDPPASYFERYNMNSVPGWKHSLIASPDSTPDRNKTHKEEEESSEGQKSETPNDENGKSGHIDI